MLSFLNRSETMSYENFNVTRMLRGVCIRNLSWRKGDSHVGLLIGSRRDFYFILFK